ncbi:sperm-associated antigen 7 isoform X2 [Vulpes vulpes]|uniref:Sperm-associated antigen 7 isoform X2 n=1 Tax=Vulpes vulpes TaxID=9627 RepID=A0ABM4Y769_VULVU
MGGTEGALAVRLVAGPPPGFPSGPGGLRSLRELGRAGAGGAEPSVCGLPALVTPEQAARLKKLQEQEKQQKVEFRKRMEKEVSDFIQDSGQIKKKFQPMNKIERSILHDVVEVAGLTSFSFGEDDECRYVMIFKKEFAPSDEELDSYRRGEEWDPQKAEEKRKLKELAQRQEEEAAQQGPVVVSPASDYKDKYSHLIGKGAAKDAAHMLQANKTYGCVPVANKRDTRSIEEAMNEIRAKKRLRQSGEELPPTS